MEPGDGNGSGTHSSELELMGRAREDAHRLHGENEELRRQLEQTNLAREHTREELEAAETERKEVYALS